MADLPRLRPEVDVQFASHEETRTVHVLSAIVRNRNTDQTVNFSMDDKYGSNEKSLLDQINQLMPIYEETTVDDATASV